jgi:hypothetical protein
LEYPKLLLNIFKVFRCGFISLGEDIALLQMTKPQHLKAYELKWAENIRTTQLAQRDRNL